MVRTPGSGPGNGGSNPSSRAGAFVRQTCSCAFFENRRRLLRRAPNLRAPIAEVAQWQSVRLLTGFALVRIQPSAPKKDGEIRLHGVTVQFGVDA
jgi:hypothetical protein